MSEESEKQARIEALLSGEPVLARLATANPDAFQYAQGDV